LADVGCFTQHHRFWNFPLQDINIMCSVGANISFELNRIRPKGFWCTGANYFSAGGLFQFSDGTLGGVLPWRVRLSLLDSTISILALLFESAQVFGAIHYNFWGYTVALEQQRMQIVGITLQFHWVRPTPMKTSRVDL